MGLRYEYMSPLKGYSLCQYQPHFPGWKAFRFIGGQQGYPSGLIYAKKGKLCPPLWPRTKHSELWDGGIHAAFGVSLLPVDMNTWCNQRHNVPYVFPETQQSDNFTPAGRRGCFTFEFGRPC
jgi:hypothetical protein